MVLSKKNIIRIIIFTVFLIIAGLAIYRLFPIIQNIATEEGRLVFKDYVDEAGFGGVLALFALQFSQIFLFILPGEPIEILAGVCFGTLMGTIFILVSCLIINATVVLFVKLLGNNFTEMFNSKKKLDKIQNSKLFKNPKKLEYIMFLLFFIPGTPKDLLVYIGATLPIRKIRFIFMTTIARIPSVISSTIVGSNIIEGNIMFGIIMYGIIFLVVIIVVIILNKFDKDKTANDVISIIK